jgi:hypothetical protein
VSKKSKTLILAILVFSLFIALPIVYNASGLYDLNVAAGAQELIDTPTPSIYFPLIFIPLLTNTPTATPTFTPTPTAPPTGAPPIITDFSCFKSGLWVYCHGTVQNVGSRTISDVVVSIIFNGQTVPGFADTGTNLILPGGTHDFYFTVKMYATLNSASASIYSWVEH